MKTILAVVVSALIIAITVPTCSACTGISLRTQDGRTFVGRTVEWSLSDAGHYRIAVFPRNRIYSALTPDGPNGLSWTGRFGFVSMTAYGQNYGPDGMNEEGLYVGMYYLPGFAGYADYDPRHADRSLSVGDLMQWMLSSFKTVYEVRENLSRVQVVNVQDDRFGGAALPFHWKISDPSGACIVLEIVEKGEIRIYDAFLGVITNAPTYDWHLTNLRNYISLSPEPTKPLTIGDLHFSALGSGSGMIGLPGDFTPPSRFVRAAAFVASVRPLSTSQDAIFEAFRILDSFNIPLGAVVPRAHMPKDIVGATQITSVCDLWERVYYYHSMFNREIRKIDLRKIDFETIHPYLFDDESTNTYPVKELVIPEMQPKDGPHPDSAPTAFEELAISPLLPDNCESIERVRGDVLAPIEISQVEPQLPETKGHQFNGSLFIIEVVINRNGAIRNARILQQPEIVPPLPAFGEAILKAVSERQYQPATLHGDPVCVYVNFTVSIHL